MVLTPETFPLWLSGHIPHPKVLLQIFELGSHQKLWSSMSQAQLMTFAHQLVAAPRQKGQKPGDQICDAFLEYSEFKRPHPLD